QVGNSHANGICYRVRNRRSRRYGWRLADADHATLVVAWAGHQLHDQLSDISQPCQAITIHVRVEHHACGLIHYFFFIQRITHAHDHRAEDLALGLLRTDHETTILHRDHLVDFHNAGFSIDGNVSHLHSAHATVGQIALAGILAS